MEYSVLHTQCKKTITSELKTYQTRYYYHKRYFRLFCIRNSEY